MVKWVRIQSIEFSVGVDPAIIIRREMAELMATIGQQLKSGVLEPFVQLNVSIETEGLNVRLVATSEGD